MATKSIITQRAITPPYREGEDQLESLNQMVVDSSRSESGDLLLLGERVADSTVHAWAGDRFDWQEFLHERTVARSEEEVLQWTRSHPGQNDSLL